MQRTEVAPAPEAWHAAIDYVRFTHAPNERMEKVSASYHALVARVGRSFEAEGYHSEPWRWMGYSGWRYGPVAWGEGPSGLILQASGTAAAVVWDEHPHFTGVPRLDIQCTAWYKRADEYRARWAEHETLNARSSAKGRPWKVRYIDGHGDGDTLYVGARGKKAKFLRVYDKYAESNRSPDFAYAWRYEAELTDDHAREACGQLLDSGASCGSVYSLLASYFNERGITLPLGTPEYCVERDNLPHDETSLERKLRWLSSQVAPSIEKMLGQGASLEVILEALRLDRRGYRG